MDVKIRKPFDGDFAVTFKFGEAPQWYLDKIGYPHSGIDYALPTGTAVLSCDEGMVSRVDKHPLGWGNFVQVNHAWGVSHYAHLSAIKVKVGQQVKAGEQVGLSGATGYVTGAHLHFGIKVNGVPAEKTKGWTDPTPYFSGEAVCDVIKCPSCGTVFPVEMAG